MNYLSTRCNQCGKWRANQTKDITNYVFKCFNCNNQTKLKHKTEIDTHIDMIICKSMKHAELVTKEMNNR